MEKKETSLEATIV